MFVKARSALVVITTLCTTLVLESAWTQSDLLPGRVLEVRVDRGQATLRFSNTTGVTTGSLGFIQSRQGPVDFRVTNKLSESDVIVREENRQTMTAVRVGDRALLYPSKSLLLKQTEDSFNKIDRFLESIPTEDKPILEQAPDLLADVTDDTLLDYEAWLLQLEAEEISAPADSTRDFVEEDKKPHYPDLEINQTLRTGVDYDQFVFHATSESEAPRRTERQIGRFVSWNYFESGDLDRDRHLYFENEIEMNQDFFYEEMNFTVKRDLRNGDRFWWDNRSIWKVFQNDQGDSFVQNDFEARYIQKLSDEWEWQRGIELDLRHEYEGDRDDGFIRGTLISEWNYREGFDKWVDIGYELTRESRFDSENSSQDYWEHRLLTHVFTLDDDISFDFDGDFYYRDYNQPGSEEDEFISVWTATCRRRLDDSFSKGWRLTMEPRFYPTTEDLNSNALRAELARLYEYSKGTELFVTVEPRFSQVFHFGEVPDDIPLDPRLPRDKSDGDYREAGMNFSISWFPNDQWRVNLFEDVYHRWFPEGETGVTAFYLFDFPRIADFTGTYSSLSVDYIPQENLQFSFTVSHSKQFFDTFDENESSTFNVGLEAIYRF